MNELEELKNEKLNNMRSTLSEAQNIIFRNVNDDQNRELTPAFRVGDVVNITDDPNRVYVVNESIFVDDGENTRYMYEVSSVYGDEDDIITCEESSLTFQYHDLSYEEYFTEGTRSNGLPAWRGKPYNYYQFITVDRSGDKERIELNTKLMEEYDDYTIPATSMKHILESHSIYERINSVLHTSINSNRNRDILRRKFNLTDKELEVFRNDVCDVILARNQNDMDPLYKRKKKVGDKEQYDFTKIQLKFIDEIDILDRKENEDMKFKDHYPIKMTNLQIMQAIEEAYNNAKKTGKRKHEPMQDERNGEIVVPIKGKVLYEGESSTHGLVIQFWYNFDMNIIETAYPLRMNNNAKKH